MDRRVALRRHTGGHVSPDRCNEFPSVDELILTVMRKDDARRTWRAATGGMLRMVRGGSVPTVRRSPRPLSDVANGTRSAWRVAAEALPARGELREELVQQVLIVAPEARAHGETLADLGTRRRAVAERGVGLGEP